MSTRTTDEKASADVYITMSGVDWATFEGLADRTRGGRITYDDGELEIMSPSIRHEGHGDRLREFVAVFCEALGIDNEAVGSTTWKAPGARKGVEADAAFYLDPGKIPVVADLIRCGETDVTRFPAPDLVIEIDMRSPPKDRLAIYSAIGAVEVWDYDGDGARVRRLGPDGSYADVVRSGWFPCGPDDIARVAADRTTGQIARRRAMRRLIDDLVAEDRA